MPHRRKLLWLVFWVVLLVTPVLVAAVLPIIRQLLGFRLPTGFDACLHLGSIITGGTVSGFLLARLMNEDTTDFIRQGLGYSIAFSLLHLMVVAVLMAFLI